MLLDLQNLVKKYNLNINGVLHIGAHFGEENIIYENLKIENRIFFEPLDSNFQVLKKNIPKKFQIVKKALGYENKKISMYVETVNQGQSSSILEPLIHLKQYPHITFDSMEEVDMIRLDDFNFDRTKFNFINIDVQGYELEVFKGARNTLNSIEYIMCEINRDEVYKNCVKIDELQKFLSEYDFILTEENWAGQTWGDGFFIKKTNK
jgi:FkbM family methyltransferase